MFTRKEEITEEWLLNQGFSRVKIGIRDSYSTITKHGGIVSIYPYRTESEFDFFWTCNDRLLDDLYKKDSDKVLSVLNNY